MNNYKWMKVDTAANMFASIQKNNTARVFRISFVLKNEDVKPEILRIAAEDIMKRFPGFNYRYKEGFFWSYLEEAAVPVTVAKESEMPAAIQWFGRNGGPELRVLYYKRRISVELSHLITDGDGAFKFSKALLAHYINLCGKTNYTDASIIDIHSEPCSEETENAYKRYYSGNKATKPPVSGTYAFSDTLNADYVKAVHGIMPISDLKERCKHYNVTVTEYLCAAAIFAVIKSAKKPIKSPVRISVPINIRQAFPSNTIRNFSCDTSLDFSPEGRTDVTFEEILSSIQGKLKKNVTNESLQNFIDATYSKTINPILRIVPYFIKKPVVNSGQIKTHREGMTLIISNLGNIALPEWISEKIERVDIESGNGSVYGLPILSTCASVNGYLNICFSQCMDDTSFCREYFKTIADDSVRVRVETSDGNGYNENERNTDGKRCLQCDVDLGEEYTVCPLCGIKAQNAAKKIDGLKTAEYPLSFTQPDQTTVKLPKAKLSKEKLKAYFNL